MSKPLYQFSVYFAAVPSELGATAEAAMNSFIDPLGIEANEHRLEPMPPEFFNIHV